jgi:predicted TIM-barrel fold metal-dependent hydrolase
MTSGRRFISRMIGAGIALSTHGLQAAPQNTQRRMIVDSQIHLWKASTPERPWAPGARAQLPEPFTIERLVPMMNDAGVDRVVIVPPTLEGERLDYAQEAVKRYPGRFAIMGRIALENPESARRLPTWREQPGVLGIRLNFNRANAVWLTDGTADWFWPAAEKYAIPTMFLTSGQTSLFARIAERHPGLPLIVDHMGVSTDAVRKMNIPIATLIEQTAALAKYPNVSVKLSAAPNASKEHYPFRDMMAHIERLYDAYGPRRCYWGTDITNSLDKATYRERVTHFTEELPFLTEEDKDWIMGRALLARLNWT